MDRERLKAIKAIVCDVDGVLTDGSIEVGSAGETKSFFVRDGLAIKLAQKVGIKVALLSGRFSPPTETRAGELGIRHVKVGRLDKETALRELSEELNIAVENMLYIGDDIIDIAPLQMAGAGYCPADACEEVKAIAHVAPFPGGKGAVRYIIEQVLKAQGHWDRIVAGFGVKNA